MHKMAFRFVALSSWSGIAGTVALGSFSLGSTLGSWGSVGAGIPISGSFEPSSPGSASTLAGTEVFRTGVATGATRVGSCWHGVTWANWIVVWMFIEKNVKTIYLNLEIDSIHYTCMYITIPDHFLNLLGFSTNLMRSKHYQNTSAFMPWISTSEALESDLAIVGKLHPKDKHLWLQIKYGKNRSIPYILQNDIVI